MRQIAKNVGVSEATDPGLPGKAGDDVIAQLREAHERSKLLEQEADVMRRAVGTCLRASTEMMYPLVLDLADDDVSRHGDLPRPRILYPGLSTRRRKALLTQQDWENPRVYSMAK